MIIYSEISKTIGETPLVRLNTMNEGLIVIGVDWGSGADWGSGHANLLKFID